ncbi:LPS translocon maturation chaperone LptM [Legionella spiritensis]|nr:lipoprotein [Legionella spiritensis]
MSLFRDLLIISTAVCILASCGQKGPLYLPTEEPATHIIHK